MRACVCGRQRWRVKLVSSRRQTPTWVNRTGEFDFLSLLKIPGLMKWRGILYIYFVYVETQKYNSEWWVHLLAVVEFQKQKALHKLYGTDKLKMQTPYKYRLSVEIDASWKQNLKMHRCIKHLRKNTDLLFSSHTTSLADVWNQRCTSGNLSKPAAPMQKQLLSAYFIFACEAGIFQCIEMSNFCINQSEKDSSPPPTQIFFYYC